ncbi:unnamed protein product [Prunus brigantina]
MGSARREKPRIGQEHTPIHVRLVRREKPKTKDWQKLRGTPQSIWDRLGKRKVHCMGLVVRIRILQGIIVHSRNLKSSVHEYSHLEISHASCGSNMHKLAIGQWESHF